MTVVVASALLAGCAGSAALVPQQITAIPPGGVAGLGAVPSVVAPPKCKGQKNTKEYATVAKQTMKAAGGGLCVPAFGGWGGALQYPSINMGYTVALTSSTKAYKPSLFPPPGSSKPIYYLQYTFNGFPSFGGTLPKGSPLVSAHVSAKKKYTIQLWENVIVGWSELSSCYAVAAKSKYGGALSKVGQVFAGQFYRETSGVIEVFGGQLASNQC